MAVERGATVILSDIIEDQQTTADSLDSAFSTGCDVKRRLGENI